jgi:hypothetical protein
MTGAPVSSTIRVPSALKNPPVCAAVWAAAPPAQSTALAAKAAIHPVLMAFLHALFVGTFSRAERIG